MDGADGGLDSKSFGSKPARGWSHADSIISNEGVTFNVRVCKKKPNIQHNLYCKHTNISFFFALYSWALIETVYWMPGDKNIHESFRLHASIISGQVSLRSTFFPF